MQRKGERERENGEMERERIERDGEIEREWRERMKGVIQWERKKSVWVCVCLYLCGKKCVCVCVCPYLCGKSVCVYVYVYMCVCMSVSVWKKCVCLCLRNGSNIFLKHNTFFQVVLLHHSNLLQRENGVSNMAKITTVWLLIASHHQLKGHTLTHTHRHTNTHTNTQPKVLER